MNALFEVQYSSTTGHTDYRASIVGGTGVVAIRTIRDDGVLTTRYITGNHLGGVSAITDEVGTVDERMSYGAFGERRDPATWQPYASLPDLTDITDKGYTGQQQLDAVGLIHMNGRVYDPEIGRFISADPTVPDPLDSQSFARYAYVENNPLSAMDPSGFGCTPTDYGDCPNAPGTSPIEVCSGVCYATSTLAPLAPLNDNVIDQASTTFIAPLPTVPPIDTTPSSAPLPIPTASGGNGSGGSGNYNPANPGSDNFLLPIDTPCQYGSNCGGNNGVQQAMNDTNGVQDVSFGDIDWGSMGSGKIRGPRLIEIPSPGAPTGGGATASHNTAPGSVGMTLGQFGGLNGGLGVGLALTKNSFVRNGLWRGSNGMWYTIGRYFGNQYGRTAAQAVRYGRIAHVAGKASLYIGLLVSGAQYYNDVWVHGNTAMGIRDSLDPLMGVVALDFPFGTIAAGLWFGGELLYDSGAFQSMEQVEQTVGPGFTGVPW